MSLLSRSDGEFSRRIQTAVERASLDPPSDASSEEEEDELEEAAVAAEEEDSIVSGDAASVSSSCSTSSSSALSVLGLCAPLAPLSRPEHKTIPTVSNPNSVYQVGCVGSAAQRLRCDQFYNFFFFFFVTTFTIGRFVFG